MIKSESLTYSYDGKTTLSFPDINCNKGEQLLLLGNSGSGKTTLLHLLGGLLQTQQGNIQIGDTSLKSLSTSKMDRFRGKHIGIIFQKSHFVKALNVEENLLLAQKLAGQTLSKAHIAKLLGRLNMAHKIKAKTTDLSIGEQQRIAIARALINQPDVILADEPTSALDDTNCNEVLDLLEQQAQEENAALLIVTHDGRLKERIANQLLL